MQNLNRPVAILNANGSDQHGKRSLVQCLFKRDQSSAYSMQGSHKLWKSWKNWKVTKKSSMHGKIIEFEKPE